MPYCVHNCRMATAKRNRATMEQLIRMMDFFGETPGLAGSRFQKLHEKSDCDRKWSELASTLNCLGGAVKSVEQWRTVWRDLKSRTSIKVRDRIWNISSICFHVISVFFEKMLAESSAASTQIAVVS
ncbi:uncharacterized protein LOC110119009 [Ceratitis capitata]|uniref:uncharacterized protein LOC110119009 n=1 Tax=Ceratitis capitata TaxID=7213 RepID=UPI000A0FC686|nr:uncharacterized protein LOC110119009 [Ceratitis capitata]